MCAILSRDEVSQRVQEKDYTLLEGFTRTIQEKALFRCNKCGVNKTFKIVNVILGKCKCKNCENITITKDRKVFIHKLSDENNYTVVKNLGITHKRSDNVILSCNKCSHVRSLKVSTIMSKGLSKCPKCSRDNKLRDFDRCVDACDERGLVVLSKVAEDPLRVSCISCSHEKTISFSTLFDSPAQFNCPICKYRDWIDEKSRSLEDCGYDLLDYSYRPRDLGCSVDYLMKCRNCDHEFIGDIYSFSDYERPTRGVCPSCREKCTGFNPDKPGTFYYLRVETNNKPLYKIGITNRTVEKRFTLSDMDKITVLRTLTFEEGRSASDLEKYYLNLFRDHQYKGEPILSSGNTELFTHDILHLDNLTD